MRCPNCGFEMPENKNVCLRCGFVVKSVTVFDSENEKNHEDKQKVKVISEDDVFVRRPRRVENVGFGFGGGLFGGILSSIFGSPITFAFDPFGQDDEDDDDEKDYILDDFGEKIPLEKFEKGIIELDDDDIDVE